MVGTAFLSLVAYDSGIPGVVFNGDKSISRTLVMSDAENRLLKPYLYGLYYSAEIEKRPEKRFVEAFYRKGLFDVRWSGGIQVYDDETLYGEGKIFDINKYKKLSNGRQLSGDHFYDDIMAKDYLHFEIRYPDKEPIQWLEIMYTDGDLKIPERIEFDLSEKIEIEFEEINNKISSLCECLGENEREDCRTEARLLTGVYIRMYYFFANHPKSQGRTEVYKNPDGSMTRRDMQNAKDFRSGWVCFNWAFLTQAALSKVTTKYYEIQWNSVCEGYPEIIKDNVFAHNWIGVKIKNIYCPWNEPQTEGIIHLDPWVGNRIAAYSTDEYVYQNSWNYYGNVFPDPGFYEGTYFENGITYPVKKAGYKSWETRWPDWPFKGVIKGGVDENQ